MDPGEVHASSSLPFLSLIVAAACLAFSTLLALSLEVLVSALVSVCAQFLSQRESVHDAHQEEAEEYTLNREGCEIADGLVIAVVRQSCHQRIVVVSDETGDDSARVRRMYFFFAPTESKAGDSGEFFTSTIQTEMLLDNGSVDPTVLRSKWNCLMVAALAFAGPPPTLRRVCVLGHGGGALSSFLNKVLQCNVTAVDADADVLSLARSHFGDVAHVHLKVAADFLLHLDCAQTFDAVFVDLCSSSSQPLAAPPACMYEADVIHALFVCSPVVVVNVLGASTSTPSDVRRVESAFAEKFSTQWLIEANCSNFVLLAARTLTPTSELLTVNPLLPFPIPPMSATSRTVLERWVAEQPSALTLKQVMSGLELSCSTLPPTLR